MNSEINDVLQQFKKDLENFHNAKVKCGIIGRSGTGKSSLMNAIAGEIISAVGEVETTMDISKPFEHKGLLFYDLPGSSTKNFPKETYIEKTGIRDFDCVILVTSDRFYEDDLFLIKEVSKIGIPVFAVRNKIDQSITSAEKRGVSESETLKNIFDDLNNNLQGIKSSGIYLVSAENPFKYDFNKLIEDIAKNLNKIKKERFIADVTASSTRMITEKRVVAEKIVSRYAALSAANGLNPIPGLDISVDIGLLVKMANDITNIYGLTKSSQEYYESFLDLSNTAKLRAALAKISQYVAKYLGKEAIMILLKRFALSAASKTASKWIPLVGLAISAGIGFKMTSSVGNEMINDAEALALEIFNSLKQ
ncbi:GTP-binding protein [Chryseobacterium sp. Leaf394]|uniref:GTP-binding protein n=1 Tax=Chryseobacterium sp. Leaf394 TaxID=1736361 RepID=UPI0006F28045|nr:GTP-binding protein [Chryseobacterium sp. Leaf394]KQS89168.1 hypothetical protein ASG21_15360 [Chryseobacterium sp. Leaf394]